MNVSGRWKTTLGEKTGNEKKNPPKKSKELTVSRAPKWRIVFKQISSGAQGGGEVPTTERRKRPVCRVIHLPCVILPTTVLLLFPRPHIYLPSFGFVALRRFSCDSLFSSVSRSRGCASSIWQATKITGHNMGIQFATRINDTPWLAVYFQSASLNFQSKGVTAAFDGVQFRCSLERATNSDGARVSRDI